MKRAAAGSRRTGLAAALAVGAFVAAAVSPPSHAALKEPLKLAAGLLGGGVESSPGIRAFKGIPFAAPPVGALRWQPPQAVPKWKGVRDASKFGDVCLQPAGQGRLNIAFMEGSPPASEDCLYLNVWTGAEAASDKRPVMVWLFGGAFTEGAGSAPLYDGDALARKGVIVVTMNYRLGPYGFFVHPVLTAESAHKASGNYGLMDMLASLRWVQSNIAAFGGDPRNVTVFGQSAGAMAISSLVASPLSKGLFHRAISESGAWMGFAPSPGMRTRAQAEEVGLKAATDAGVTTAEQLRAMSTEDVTAKFRSAGMLVDGWVIPEDPSATFAAGRQNAVDVLVGSNKDDLSFFPIKSTTQRFEQEAHARWGNLADDYLKLYPHATDAEASTSQADSANDGAFWHMRLYADYQVKRGNGAWLYYFAQNPPAPAGQPPLPAAHASEVPYVFNNLGKPPLFPDRSVAQLSAASAPDQKVADRMSSYWANFARSGNPNGPGLPPWQAHQVGASERAMILDAEPATEHLPDKARLALFDRLYEQVRHAAH